MGEKDNFLQLFELSSSEMDDFGVEVILKYKLPFMKVIIEFFLPAVIFMGIR